MYISQNGCCPVCGGELSWCKKHIDHDHKTGKVRGLTHPYCNIGVGFIDNHRERVPQILMYLGLANGD
jgi:hypothetical protein